ncbi:hypothetical protein BKA65DRAFT_538310 [Rhexocercosporidium sp. MPI-PUGE-AT-0058]|nr:hypothetical protein BKA65DRAFT_538310 [Rhexocercosporidium sp. MPI-PUGE-AT-0058]
MLLISAGKLAWLNLVFFALSSGSLLPTQDKCAPGEYWCQDRCGSDAYGDTCCRTPSGRHNLCGAGTICCLDGCCPSGTVCNAVGGCDKPAPGSKPPSSAIVSRPSNPGPTPSDPKDCGDSSIVTCQTTVTEHPINTVFITITFVDTCTMGSTSSDISSSLKSSSESIKFSSGDSSANTTISTTAPSPITRSTKSSLSSPGVSFSSDTSSSGLSSGSAMSSGEHNPGPSFSASTWTNPDGATIVSSSSVFVINGSITIPISPVSSPTTFTTSGEIFTLLPTSSLSSTGLASTVTRPDGQTVISHSGVVIIGSSTITLPSVSSSTTLTTLGETFTLNPSSPISSTTQVSSGLGSTFTRPDGQTVISNSGVVIIGSSTITLPSVSSSTTLTTLGETFTLNPSGLTTSSQASSVPLTTTFADGQIGVSSSGVVVIGGSVTITLPQVSSSTVLTTAGQTFTLTPPGLPGSGSSRSSGPVTTTFSDGQIGVSSSGVVVIGGSVTITLPTVSSRTTLTSGGQTFTLSPPSSLSTPTISPTNTPIGVTRTLPDGQIEVSSSGIIIIGGSLTITVPTTLTAPSTVTTFGQTFTWPSGQPQSAITSQVPFLPCVFPTVAACVPCPVATQGCWPTSQLPCDIPVVPVCTPCLLATQGCWPFGGSMPATTTTTSSSSGTTTPLPVFATWPSGATIQAVPTDGGGGGGGGGKSSCRMWFFFICIDTPGLHIGGWNWINFPPGIYPLSPPPFPIINLPTPWKIQGTLPPWPPITIGIDGQPTFPPEPANGCKTEPASMCQTETSFGVSGTITTTTNIASSCATILGCDLTNTAITATQTGTVCSEATVTDVWATCSGTACSTTSTATRTGCSLTASSTTTSASSCPLATLDPTDDLGDDGGGAPYSVPGVLVTSTFSETVLVSGTVYPVASGLVLIGTSTLTITSVSAQTITSLPDGQRATILPSFVGTKLSITDPAMTLVPIFPRPTAIPTSTTTSPVVITGTGTITDTSPTDALPTLTTATSPTASSCVSSATLTQCALSPGGQSACVPVPTCLSWVQKTTSTPTPTPTSVPSPKQGFYLGKITFPGATNFVVVPYLAADCQFLKTKFNPVGLIVVQSDTRGQSGTPFFGAGASFSLRSTGIPSYYPLCGDLDLILSFRPAQVNGQQYEYAPVESWNLNQPPAGYCIPVAQNKFATCVAASDNNGEEVVTLLWQCQKEGDPSFCSAAPPPQ